MNKYFFLIALSSCLILLAVSGFAAAEDHGDRVCIYNHEDFHGHEQCFRPGEQVSDLKHSDIESIRVYGHAHAMLYEDRDFRGHMMEFSANIPDVKRLPLTGSKEFHDHIGSLRVTSDSAYNNGKFYEPDYRVGRFKPFPGPQTMDEGVCVYDRPKYEGQVQCWSSGTDISDLNSGNWGDRISSVRVFGNGRLLGFRDTDFRGDRIVVDHDVSDLSDRPMRFSGNWNHEISSLQVQ
jgi:hypothetical protein